jgi:hypothetical protein
MPHRLQRGASILDDQSTLEACGPRGQAYLMTRAHAGSVRSQGASILDDQSTLEACGPRNEVNGRRPFDPTESVEC